jgi:hypothetical protein
MPCTHGRIQRTIVPSVQYHTHRSLGPAQPSPPQRISIEKHKQQAANKQTNKQPASKVKWLKESEVSQFNNQTKNEQTTSHTMTFKQFLSVGSAPSKADFPNLDEYMIGMRFVVATCYGLSLGIRGYEGGMGLVLGGSLM